MVDPDRRPTAQEIEELIDLVRRDPGSPAFIDLGEAYLSLGRPRDAIQVGNLGLESAPDNLEGRVMLARAFAALHQWKEAQGELLRVVKVDRSNRHGFALLGEVLLRRNDYERAVPVLQHAQNLDPTSPSILTMLKRARSGQALDPPAPIPQPVPPRGETANPGVVHSNMPGGRQPPGPTVPARSARMPAQPPQPVMPYVPTAAPQVPTMAIQPAPPPPAPAPVWNNNNNGAQGGWNAYEQPAPPPMPPPAPAPRANKPTTPPPPSNIEGVRPRIVSSAKVQNAAAASLRQSAAVGENYLNELLTGGLLDVVGVRVPEQEYDLRPDRRWGRSTRRAFIFLFVVLVVGIGGGGTWYWWDGKQTAEAVARLQKESRAALINTDHNAFMESLDKLATALKKDSQNVLTWAYTAEIAGIAALLYGAATDVDSDAAFKQVREDIAEGEPGYRELVIGHAAVGLARLNDLPLPEKNEKDPRAIALLEITNDLDKYIAKASDDRWANWLRARAHLEAGERKQARSLFKSTADGTEGLVPSKIDLAHMMIDDGDYDDAVKLLADVETKIKDHPLAVIANSLGRAEAYLDPNPIYDALAKPTLKDDKIPPKIRAYKSLVTALANLSLDDHVNAMLELNKAVAGSSSSKVPTEARFVARVAWLYYVLGDLEKAALYRFRVGKKVEVDPHVQLVSAALQLTSGLPQLAIDELKNLGGQRAKMIKTQALLDKNLPKEAIAEANSIIKFQTDHGVRCVKEKDGGESVGPTCQHALLMRAQADLITSDKAGRDAADTELKSYASAFSSKIGKHALGTARRAVKWDADDVFRTFKDALDICPQSDCTQTDIKSLQPNPIAYRTFTALAELAIENKELAQASRYLNWVLNNDLKTRPELAIGSTQKIIAVDEKGTPTFQNLYLRPNRVYYPAKLMMARVLLRADTPDKALPFLEEVLNQKGFEPTPELILTQIEIYATLKQEKYTTKATDLLKANKGKPGIPETELGRIASLIDPKLPKDLDLPEPKSEKDEKDPKKDPKKK